MASDAVEWLTIPQAAAYLQVARGTLYRWAKSGRVRLYRFGEGTTRLKRSDLDALAQPMKPSSHDDDMAWTRLSEAAFWEDWNNDKDAVYDNWREIYGVPEG